MCGLFNPLRVERNTFILFPRISFGVIHIKPLWVFRKIRIQNVVELFLQNQDPLCFLKKNQHIKFVPTISMETKFAWRFEKDKIQNML